MGRGRTSSLLLLNGGGGGSLRNDSSVRHGSRLNNRLTKSVQRRRLLGSDSSNRRILLRSDDASHVRDGLGRVLRSGEGGEGDLSGVEGRDEGGERLALGETGGLVVVEDREGSLSTCVTRGREIHGQDSCEASPDRAEREDSPATKLAPQGEL